MIGDHDMTSADGANKKVVDLTARRGQAESSPEKLGELLRSVRALAGKRLTQFLNSLFENVDDALFDLAEKAENNSRQSHFFDGMREVRKKRQLVERLFHEQITRAFQDFVHKRPLKRSAAEVANPHASAGELTLSLVEADDLEETLAVNNMTDKANNRLSRHLFAVGQRLTVINGGSAGGKLDPDDNPLGPGQLCLAYQTACAEFDIDVQVRLIIFKLFDKHVLSALDQLYDEANAHLIEAGVLPQLKTAIPMRRPAGMPLPPGVSLPPPPVSANGDPLDAAAAAAYYAQAGYPDPNDALVQTEMFRTIQGLLAQRRGLLPLGAGGVAGIGGVAGSAPSGPMMASSDLLSALSILQGELLLSQAQAIAQNANLVPLPQAGSVQQVKDELIEQVRKLTDKTKDARVNSADEDTIDLVGMLFEFILQDRNLPAPVQAVLSRLQIPYLKVAILDKHLFAQKSHPARRLLDELAQAGMTWTDDGDKDRRLLAELQRVVEVILKEFDEDLSIFDREVGNLQNFLSGNKRRAEVTEQRTTEATKGREKLQAARKRAAKEILTRTEGKPLPEFIRNVLTKPWANVLVLMLLRHGEDTPAWRGALKVAEELAWSGSLTHPTEADRTRLKALMGPLSQQLRQGLSLVAYNDADINQLLAELSKCYQALFAPSRLKAAEEARARVVRVGDDISIPEPLPIPLELTRPAALPGSSSVADFVEEVVLSTRAEMEAVEAVESDEDYLAQVRACKVGQWFEFTDEAGNSERAKLSWISPISSKYLFVNRKGLKVADKTIFGLAAEIKRGTAQILQDVPLFDRALDAIVEKLKVAPKEGDEAAPVEIPSPPKPDGLELT
jgi:hypothetical protein